MNLQYVSASIKRYKTFFSDTPNLRVQNKYVWLL